MASVTGTIKSTVVTLSRKAESTAVAICSISMMPAGCALAARADHTATNSNMPERRDTETRIIMPVSRPSVFQSTPLIASSCSSTPITIMTPAPVNATMARLTFSDMITA